MDRARSSGTQSSGTQSNGRRSVLRRRFGGARINGKRSAGTLTDGRQSSGLPNGQLSTARRALESTSSLRLSTLVNCKKVKISSLGSKIYSWMVQENGTSISGSFRGVLFPPEIESGIETGIESHNLFVKLQMPKGCRSISQHPLGLATAT